MKYRIAIWIITAVVCSPLVLMIWFPGAFTEGLRFVLAYHLELAILVGVHVLGLWFPYARRTMPGGRAMLIFLCLVSIAAFVYLAHSYTYRAFCCAIIIGCSYGTLSDLQARKGIWASKKINA
jgi:hypothetical protein